MGDSTFSPRAQTSTHRTLVLGKGANIAATRGNMAAGHWLFSSMMTPLNATLIPMAGLVTSSGATSAPSENMGIFAASLGEIYKSPPTIHDYVKMTPAQAHRLKANSGDPSSATLDGFHLHGTLAQQAQLQYSEFAFQDTDLPTPPLAGTVQRGERSIPPSNVFLENVASDFGNGLQSALGSIGGVFVRSTINGREFDLGEAYLGFSNSYTNSLINNAVQESLSYAIGSVFGSDSLGDVFSGIFASS